MSQQKLMRRDTPLKLNKGLSIAKISSVALTPVLKRDTLNVTGNVEKGTPLSLIASPTIMKKFKRRTDEISSLDECSEMNNNSQTVSSRQYIVAHQYDHNDDDANDDTRPRSSTWTGQAGGGTTSDPIPLTVHANPPVNEKIKKFTINMERKSKSVKKLRELVEKVLRKNLEHVHYDARLSKRRCTHLSQILETTFKSSLNVGDIEYKVAAMVYIGEIRDDGMRQACQYNWNPNTDVFVMETYRREDMFATGIVFATLMETKDEIDDNFGTFDENEEFLL